MDKFLDRMKNLLGDEFGEYMKFYSSDSAYRGLRVNTLKCSADRLSSLLGFELKPTPFCSEGFYIPDGISGLGNNPLHHAGAFYIQEPSATSAVTMLKVEKGDKVLDLCAAPGGKSTQIAAELGGTGLLWSNEIVRNRALILLSNIERMGVRNAVVSNSSPDALCKRLEGFFDKVLVDAPCSGEGMFRKNDSKNEWSVEHVQSCAERQLQILNSAKLALKENGVLVYSTCTFSPEENEGVIERFLSQNPDFSLEDSGVTFGRPTLDFARRIFPMDGGEGHFAARLRRNSQSGFAPVFETKKEKPEMLKKLYDEVFEPNSFGEELELFGDYYCAFEPQLPDTRGIKLLRKGVAVLSSEKRYILPHHAAFTASKPGQCRSVLDLDINDDRIKKFLHGEEIELNGKEKGFTAVCVNGITVGFGKAAGRLKNKYPKGLRTL